MGISIGSEILYKSTANLSNEHSQAERLKEKLNQETATDEEIMEVCKSFEAYMLEQVMKEMENTIPKEEKKDPYLEQFGDLLYKEYAEAATKNKGIGIAQMLYEAMKRNA